MANIKKIRRPAVTIDIGDGKERTLKYNLNAFAEMEEKYGSVDEALQAMEKGSIKAVRFMLWIGLVHEDKALTEEHVGDLIDILDMEEIAEKMNKVIVSDLPDKEGNDTLPNA